MSIDLKNDDFPQSMACTRCGTVFQFWRRDLVRETMFCKRCYDEREKLFAENPGLREEDAKHWNS